MLGPFHQGGYRAIDDDNADAVQGNHRLPRSGDVAETLPQVGVRVQVPPVDVVRASGPKPRPGSHVGEHVIVERRLVDGHGLSQPERGNGRRGIVVG